MFCSLLALSFADNENLNIVSLYMCSDTIVSITSYLTRIMVSVQVFINSGFHNNG
jgi:hypothetical protein